ncbi:MAG: hypothetical protein KJZ83_09955, partial [Burkholderiaceae bacterium]|nr:hypothetical protein [Burkholderiaceae bacterium]
AADPVLRARNAALKHWQARRLGRTHADLLDDPRYRAAARFFLDDLYGGKDFSQRDTELARVIPTLARMLPNAALGTIADAVELDALTERLDEALAGALGSRLDRGIDEAQYAQAYRHACGRGDREHQLDLVLSIGRSLDRLVRHPLLGGVLRAMAAPARIAGVTAMHEFLVRGFGAFRGIGGASEFLARIDLRERSILQCIYCGQNTGWTNPGPD